MIQQAVLCRVGQSVNRLSLLALIWARAPQFMFFQCRAWSRAQHCYVDMQYQTVCLHHPDTGDEGYVNIWCSHDMLGEPCGVRYATVASSRPYSLWKHPRK